MPIMIVDVVIGDDKRAYVYTPGPRELGFRRLLLVFKSLDDLFCELEITEDPNINLSIYFPGERPEWMTPWSMDPEHVMRVREDDAEHTV